MSKRPEETTSEQFERRLIVAIDVNKKMAAFMADGVPVDSEDVLDVMSDHHDWATEYLKKDRTTYLRLAHKCRTDDRFEGIYGQYAAGLSQYMADAIEAYANARLTDDIEDTGWPESRDK